MYAYDHEGHMTEASGGIVTGGPWYYLYDGTGARIAKCETPTSSPCASAAAGTLFWRDIAGNTLAESDLSGNITKEYIYFAGQRTAWVDASSGDVYYYYTDQIGSVRRITTQTGTPCYNADFTPYGQEIYDGATSCQQNYKFAGYERDSETGLDYAHARYYNSRLGRFTSPDPLSGGLGNPQSLNRYAYVVNNPVNNLDPSGLFCNVGQSCNGDGWNSGWGSDGGIFDGPANFDGSFSLPNQGWLWDPGILDFGNVWDPTDNFASLLAGTDSQGLIGYESVADGCPESQGEDCMLTYSTVPVFGFVGYFPQQPTMQAQPQQGYGGPGPGGPKRESMAACVTGELIGNFLGAGGDDADSQAYVTAVVNLGAYIVAQGGKSAAASLLPGPGWVYIGGAAIWDGIQIFNAYATCKRSGQVE